MSDPLYQSAIIETRKLGRVSTPHLQRVFGIGYTRAHFLVEAMKQDGVVSGEGAPFMWSVNP